MREHYPTEGIVLMRRPTGESSVLLTVLTEEAGLIHARAQGLRAPGAKLAAALQTFAESSVVLVRGREGWRLTGAVLRRNWFRGLTKDARPRASRIASLILRLVPGEVADQALFDVFSGFLRALQAAPHEDGEALECLAALRVLYALGLDAGPLAQGTEDAFGADAVREAGKSRAAIIARINKGIAASGL